MKNLVIVIFVCFTLQTYAQTGVAINTTGAEPDGSAMLDVTSTEKGILIPRMLEADRTAIVSPATGLLVFQTDGIAGFYYFDGTVWKNLSLVNFKESAYTWNSQTGVKLVASGDSENVDVVLSPKGTGSFLVQQPNGNPSGGNYRGKYAVDWQRNREVTDQVASGDFSVLIGGMGNKASGLNAAVVGGGCSYFNVPLNAYVIKGNTAGGTSSFIGGGILNTANGNHSFIAGGSTNTAEGSGSLVGGASNTASSYFETVFGMSATLATGDPAHFVLTDRLFTVGNGTGGNRSDALTILKNANTTIGGSLTINGNGTSTSYLFPETRGTGSQFLKTAGDGTTSWSTITKSDLGLGNVENTALTTWTGSSNITTIGTIATGTWSGTAISLTKGGTGATTKTAAFDALSPMTTLGDIVYGGANGTGTRLAKGTAGQVLTMNAGATAPVWSTPASGTVTSVTGSAPIASSGGTTPAISISAATTSAAGSMSAADKTKLDGIAANANNYSHPAGDGNLHVPATSTTNDGKVLIAGATAGSLSWGTFTESQNLTNVLTQGENAGDKKMVNIDQVGIGTDSPNAVAALEISSTTQGFLPPRMTHSQMMAITPVEGLVVYNTTVKLLLFYNGTDWIKGDGSPYLYVGKSYQGGIIFYIFQSGDPPYVAGETHGLIASTSDQSSAIRWYNGSAVATNASSKALGAGLSNTDLIISVQGATSTSYAAGLARAYNGGGYSDWFLPSENEIIKLLSAKDIVGGFEYNRYWTSSESTYFPTTKARLCNFGQYIQGEDSKALTLPVRAIRSF